MNRKRILVVDDHEMTALSFQAPLHDAGYDVVACFDGAQAIREMQKTLFDVVLTDMDMRGLNGLALTRRLREHHPSTHIFLMTGADTHADVQEALKLGAQKIFLKPVRSAELIADIAKLFVSSKAECSRVVLLVDDHLGELRPLADELRGNGYKILEAGSGFEAIDEMRKTKADVVVLDVKMPGLSGWDTYRVIKDINPAVSAIMVTGYSVSESIAKRPEFSKIPIISKPFRSEELVKKISEILATKGPEA